MDASERAEAIQRAERTHEAYEANPTRENYNEWREAEEALAPRDN